MQKPNNPRKDSHQKEVNIKLLSTEFLLYSNPIVCLAYFKVSKRAEAAQWSIEIQKMLKGIVKSVIALENLMNQIAQNKKLYLEDKEVKISKENKYWIIIYLIDNAILRIYSCLDKIAQMCRCYFEHPSNGGQLEFARRCGCKEFMDENNCNFGNLINSISKNIKRNQIIVKVLKKLDGTKSIQELRKYRTAFVHKKHILDKTLGLDPKIKVVDQKNGTISTSFSFGEVLPPVNWFRVNIVNANNAIVDCVEEIGGIIFPRDFKIKIKKSK